MIENKFCYNFKNTKAYFLMISLSVFFNSEAQEIERKSFRIKRTEAVITIDGKPDEKDWELAEKASDFIQFDPNNGAPEDPETTSEIKMLYDDDALYLAAWLYDENPDKIITQLSQRDTFDISDWFFMAINPYNDGQQEYQFLVTAANVQSDIFFTIENGSDPSWDAIWESKTNVTDKGWFVEMKIPYTSLRFPKGDVNTWEVNFWRLVKRNNRIFTWNFIDRNKGSQSLYAGKLTGIDYIDPPTRLFFIPYSSIYSTKNDNDSETTFKAGMDLKWGISDEFTLDAILIPDFGQTTFDNTEFVLGPFEQQFIERRPFFTEGIDLFSKSGIFYSRRIGEIPRENTFLQENERIISPPSSINFINAVKISGRTKSGWGIGVLNAITEKTEVEVENFETLETREEVFAPLTNYNVLVVDKRFAKNSSFTFTNTNALRSGNTSDANVTAASIDYIDKKNQYNYRAALRYSFVTASNSVDPDKTGISAEAGWQKVFGKHRYGINSTFVSKDYEINDLGINFLRNYYEVNPFYSFRILQSTGNFNSIGAEAGFTARWNRFNNKPENLTLRTSINSTTRKLNYNELSLELLPFKTYDFYEPRSFGRFAELPKRYSITYVNKPNINKAFLVEWSPGVYTTDESGRWGYFVNVAPRLRINDRLLFSTGVLWREDYKDRGFVGNQDSEIVIGGRDLQTVTVTFNGNYYINPVMSITLNFRHYWTSADYDVFYNLQEDGDYQVSNSFNENRNFTYNNWNADLNFNWWFAPASQFSILYRNTIIGTNTEAITKINSNYNELFNLPVNHTISLRVTYFLDYNLTKKWFSKK